MATSYNWEDRGTGGAHASEQFISVLNVPNPSGEGILQFNVRDEMARGEIQSILESISGGVHFIGICTDALTDGGTTNPIHISGMADTVTAEDGDIVIVRKESYSPAAKQDREFIWSGGTSGKWNLFGEVNIEDFGELAWLDASDLQTASEVVTASGAVTINSTAAGGTAVITAASGTVVTDTGVDVTGTITAPTITQGTKTPTNKYAHDVAVVTDTSVDVTGTITGPTITQGTKTPTNVYGHNATFTTEGVVLSANATTETLTFTTSTTGTATLVNNTEASADTTILSDVTYGNPTAGNITVAAGTLTDTLTTGTASIINSTETGGTALLSDVSFGNPTMGDITITAGTLTDTLTTADVSTMITTGYLHQADDTKSKVGIEKKSS